MASSFPVFKIIGGVLGAAAIFLGGYPYHFHEVELEKIRVQEEYRLQQEDEKRTAIEVEKDAQFKKLLDIYLEDFTTDMREKMTDYKKNRKMLHELVQPFNYETPEDSKNTYEHFTKTLMPYLKSQSVKVIDTFSQYKVALHKDLIDETNERRDHFQNEWNDMINTQLEKYVDYFVQEDMLLNKYKALIEFYYVHSNLIEIDIENDAFIFKRKKDELQHLELLKDLKTDQ